MFVYTFVLETNKPTIKQELNNYNKYDVVFAFSSKLFPACICVEMCSPPQMVVFSNIVQRFVCCRQPIWLYDFTASYCCVLLMYYSCMVILAYINNAWKQ